VPAPDTDNKAAANTTAHIGEDLVRSVHRLVIIACLEPPPGIPGQWLVQAIVDMGKSMLFNVTDTEPSTSAPTPANTINLVLVLPVEKLAADVDMTSSIAMIAARYCRQKFLVG
jgi:hypothetical protein